MMIHSDREPRLRFALINAIRTLFTGLACMLAFLSDQPGAGWLLAALLALAIIWLVITTFWVSAERQSGYLSLLPTFSDITLLTAYIYYTGGSLSTALLIYVYVVAVSSMNSRIPQGLFATIYIVLLYSLVSLSLSLNWVPASNIIGPQRQPSALETIQSLSLVSIICTGVFFLIRGLVRSLERKNNKLEKQAHQFQKVNRDLAAKNRMIKDELAVARRIQETLIPSTMPSGKGFRIESRYLALHEVGGDYLDFFATREGYPGILVADAAGHGVPAALVASMTKMAADRFRKQMHKPRDFLHSLNGAILDRINLHFVAACYAFYHPRRRLLKYSVAGNPPPYLLRPGKTAVALEGQGSVLGIHSEPVLHKYRIQLEVGDRIVMFTDGIDECRNRQGEQLSRIQLEALLTGVASLPPTENTADTIVRELEGFASGRGFEDDVTLVVLTVE
ncbi:MAG: PP2C family protein-serine/threonine phosphatase [Leptospiraceae bacterium]